MKTNETTCVSEDQSSQAPRKMTVAENVILTIKVLAGFGLLGLALWGISAWTGK
jgi:hypothetical protein